MAGEIAASLLHLFFGHPGLALRIVFWALIGGIALIAFSRLRDRLRPWWDIRTRGWAVEPRDDDVEYRELIDGHRESLRFRTEWFRGEGMVYVPNEARWDRASPAWARGRFAEIVARMRSRLPSRFFELKFE